MCSANWSDYSTSSGFWQSPISRIYRKKSAVRHDQCWKTWEIASGYNSQAAAWGQNIWTKAIYSWCWVESKIVIFFHTMVQMVKVYCSYVFNLSYNIFMVLSLANLMCFSGADHHPVHWLPGPDLFLLLCLLGGEGCCGWGRQDRLLQLRRCPVVGCGKAAELENRNTFYTRRKSFTNVFVLVFSKFSFFAMHILLGSLNATWISQHTLHTWKATSHVHEKRFVSLKSCNK